MSKAEFARRIGRNKSWVTRMAQAGRLVLDGSGPTARVKVEESLAAMRATAGNRDDVAARHAAARSETAPQPAEPTAGAAIAALDDAEAAPIADRGAGGDPAGPADPRAVEIERARYQKILAESRRVQAAADREEMERDKVAGNLLAREDVDAAFKFLGATVRGLLDVLPDQMAPVIAPVTDLETVHALLSDAGRDLLVRLGEAVDAQRAALSRAAN